MLDFSEGPDIDDAGRRAVVTARLADELRAELEERGEIDLYAEIEAPLVAVLARMEAAGIGVDRVYLEELGESLRDQLATLERGIHEAAGGAVQRQLDQGAAPRPLHHAGVAAAEEDIHRCSLDRRICAGQAGRRPPHGGTAAIASWSSARPTWTGTSR